MRKLFMVWTLLTSCAKAVHRLVKTTLVAHNLCAHSYDLGRGCVHNYRLSPFLTHRPTPYFSAAIFPFLSLLTPQLSPVYTGPINTITINTYVTI